MGIPPKFFIDPYSIFADTGSRKKVMVVAGQHHTNGDFMVKTGSAEASNGDRCMEMLGRLGWSKSRLCRELGLHPNAVGRWGVKWPRYAEAYLELAVMLWECGQRVRKA